MSRKVVNLQDNIQDILENKKLWYFIKWYLNGQKPEEWKSVQTSIGISQTSDWAVKTYFEREDVQRAMIEITKLNKDFNLVQIYNAMLKLALEGNINSANFILNFSKSDFFEAKSSAIDDLIGGSSLDE